ncbi:MAG: DUF84 family protein, partial [Bacteroidia bacterium]
MKIIVASRNPIKVEATRMAFTEVFPDEVLKCEGISVASGVSDQPMDEAETKLGAINRVQNAIKDTP